MATLAPTRLAIGKPVENLQRISNLNLDEISELYEETVKTLKKIDERRMTILAEDGIVPPRKRAYTFHEIDVSLVKAFNRCGIDWFSSLAMSQE